MTSSRRPFRLPIVPGFLLLLALCALVSCQPDLVVRMSTRIFEDGSALRHIEVTGLKDDGTTPAEAGWMRSEAGLSITTADGWRHLEEKPARLVAEGQFPRIDQMPAALVHHTDAGALGDRLDTMDAESVVLFDDKLRAIGARRTFDEIQLLQLTDLLARRDTRSLVMELANLLDPAVPSNPPF